MTFIVIRNVSKRATDADIDTATRAVAAQMRYDAAPAWNRAIPVVVRYPRTLPSPPGAYEIVVADNPDVANALGYHYEEGGAVKGRVFVDPVLDNHGAVLTGALSVSSVLSHEVLEAWGDPDCNYWAASDDGVLHAMELCDAVEADSYGRAGVAVSDFLLPAWFDPQAKGATNYLRTLTAPFALRRGGYEVQLANGQVREVFGAQYDRLRLAAKDTDLSRTARRMNRGRR